MAWAGTLVSLISATRGFLIRPDDSADLTSLVEHRVRNKNIPDRTEVYERLRGESVNASTTLVTKTIPLTSDSFLATFGVLAFFPMTVW